MLEFGENNGTSGLQLRRRSGASAFLVLILAFAGSCGSVTRASAEDLPTVTIGKAVDNIPLSVIEVATKMGYFRRNGVNVNEVLVQGSSAASAAMVGGSLQFALEGSEPLLLARSHGVPIMALDAIDDAFGVQLVVSNHWLAKHPIAADAPFKEKMADLNGSIFASAGTTDRSFYALLRGWAGLSPHSGYGLEQLSSLSAIAVAIERGIVDVTLQSPPLSIELVQQGYGRVLVDRRNVEQFNRAINDLVTTTSSYAQAHPQITRDVATAFAEAINFMRDHPRRTLAIMEGHFTKLDEAVIRKSITFIPFAKNGLQSQSGWDRAVTLAQETGFVKGVKAAPEGVYWTNKYIDVSKLGK